MNKEFIALLLLALPALLMADPSKKEWDLRNFTQIHNHTQANIIVEISEDFYIEAEGPRRFINRLRVTVNGDNLDIRTRGIAWALNGTPVIRIGLPVLEGLNLTGSGDARVNDPVHSDSFDLRLTGSGDAELIVETRVLDVNLTGSGKTTLTGTMERAEVRQTGSGDVDIQGFAEELNCNLTGSSSFNGRDFMVRRAEVRITGSGDANVHVEEELTARLTGSGDLNYWGAPRIADQRVSGSGNLRQRD